MWLLKIVELIIAFLMLIVKILFWILCILTLLSGLFIVVFGSAFIIRIGIDTWKDYKKG